MLDRWDAGTGGAGGCAPCGIGLPAARACDMMVAVQDRKQSPIFVKTYDLLLWLLERSARFPKNERFRMARRLEESAFAFRVYPDHRRLKSPRSRAFCRRLRRLVGRCHAGALPPARVTAAVQGWVAHAAHGDTWGLRRAVLSDVVI